MKEAKHCGRKKEAHTFLTQIKASCLLITKLEHNSMIKRIKLWYFYLRLPKPLEIRLDSQNSVFTSEEESRDAGVVALNPDVSTFRACYDPVAEWRRCGMARIYRLCHAYHHLQSR